MMFEAGNADVIVVGAGHAGIEAALAAARLGLSVICFTTTLDFVGNMPCNPAVGGTGKGQLVREIDALGGEMAKCADAACIQYRMLNRGKGPAVHSLRAQADRVMYTVEMKKRLENTENLTLKQGECIDILTENGAVTGIVTKGGGVYRAKGVILCCGTFLGGKTFVGDNIRESGPDGVFAAKGLTENLKRLGLPIRRFKTGTPPRIDGKTVDFSAMELQRGDEDIVPFSFSTKEDIKNTAVCYVTYTNEQTHNIIRASLDRSPLYGGEIEGVGPRYCPSIEDKVVRFADKKRHQLFIEPCGEHTKELYVGGLSTSLPEDVQIAMLHTIKGLEKAEIMRPGYAIEYDCLDPLCLNPTMEIKGIKGLYAAGQLCSTSGYEEAAALGLVAGINCAKAIKGEEEFILQRSDGYIGTLIDDIVTKGTNEPYRMMTSRSELRLWHRQDNADFRLADKAFEGGLVSKEQTERVKAEYAEVERLIKEISKVNLSSNSINPILKSLGSTPVRSGANLLEILKRPEVKLSDIASLMPFEIKDKKQAEQIEISVKYEGYIKRQLKELENRKKWDDHPIPEDTDYDSFELLRTEARQKLKAVRPKSLGQAGRISGVSPADISALIFYLGKGKKHDGNA